MKRRGKMTVTLEALKALLQLDESEEIMNLYRTDSDMERDCFTITISSEEESRHTTPVAEGSLIPRTGM